MLAIFLGLRTAESGNTTQESDNTTLQCGIACCDDYESFCTWPSENYSGSPTLHDPIPSGQCLDLTIYGEEGYSYANFTGIVQRVWEHGDCTGRNILVDHDGGYAHPPWLARGLGGY
jgi:hypothetical protein